MKTDLLDNSPHLQSQTLQDTKNMPPPSSQNPLKTVKTRFCLISDTHTQVPIPLSPSPSPISTTSAYRSPLPRCDVLLHAGDLTECGTAHEFETAFQTLADAPAELKIVIAGNHDVSLDRGWYEDAVGRGIVGGGRKSKEDVEGYLRGVREMWMGEEARKKGIWYLEEGVREFEVGNGGRFRVSCVRFPYQVTVFGDGSDCWILKDRRFPGLMLFIGVFFLPWVLSAALLLSICLKGSSSSESCLALFLLSIR